MKTHMSSMYNAARNYMPGLIIAVVIAAAAKFIAEKIYGDEDSSGLIAEATDNFKKASPMDLLKTRRILGILKT
ncbi:MAG: hypothetical protein P8Y36_09425, partial [Alphaproteobacteria bacterium]